GAAPGEKEEPAKPQPGKLANPKWSAESFQQGDKGEMQVEAPWLEGQSVRFIVERQEGSEWEKVSEVEERAARGTAKASVQLQTRHLEPPQLVKEKGQKPRLVAEAKGVADGTGVKFTAEKKDDAGAWTVVAEAT